MSNCWRKNDTEIIVVFSWIYLWTDKSKKYSKIRSMRVGIAAYLAMHLLARFYRRLPNKVRHVYLDGRAIWCSYHPSQNSPKWVLSRLEKKNNEFVTRNFVNSLCFLSETRLETNSASSLFNYSILKSTLS